MNYNKKKQKINPFLLISIALCFLFLFIISSKLTFVYKKVEGILEEKKSSPTSQKSFNLDALNELRQKMPLE